MSSVEITARAKGRMLRYEVSESLLNETLEKPSSVLESYGGRKIYHKRLNGHVLRIILEEDKGIKRIITVYKARRERYEI